ncbi:AAA family ATPase [Catellatospora sp. NPDC049609]|uniref:AAA family ATPase n=1 Tax=Catellatospora sp. NPDC049609 TaxID=3155505 RepID=UPI00344453B2
MIITGGPGAGKTTLIEALRERGFATAPEAGRAIIQDQVAIGGRALPWADTELFAEMGLMWELRSYRWALEQPGTVFFDHAMPSLASYYAMVAGAVPPYVEAAVRRCRYRTRAYVAPPWAEIFCNDAERKQTYAEALKLHELVLDGYHRYGYELVELPRCPVAQRVEFLLDDLGR